MKYIITESKLDMLMTDYMDNFLASKKVSDGGDVLLIYDDLGEDLKNRVNNLIKNKYIN